MEFVSKNGVPDPAIKPAGENGAKEISGQSNTVVLSDVATVKDFFKQNGLKYDKSISRAENLLANFNRLPVDDDSIYVVADISFEVTEGQEYEFPANYRARDVRVYGSGSLSFSGNEHEWNGSFVIRTETKLKSVLGVYYPEKSIVWNILTAVEVDNWPSTDEIILRGMCLDIREEDKALLDADFLNLQLVALPENINLDACYLTDTSNCLFGFCNGELMLTGEKAVAMAGGSLAKLGVSAGKGYVVGSAEGYAMDTGKIFGIGDGSRIWADGPNAKAFGMSGDVFMSVSDGALGVKHVATVNAVTDHHPNSRIRMSAIHRKLPDELKHSHLNFESPANREHLDLIVELKELADIGCPKAALMLGMVRLGNFNAVIKTGETKDVYLKRALDLGDKNVEKAACKHLALYYCSQYTLEKEKVIPLKQKEAYEEKGYVVICGHSEAEAYTVKRWARDDSNDSRTSAKKYFDKLQKIKGLEPNLQDFRYFESNNVRRY